MCLVKHHGFVRVRFAGPLKAMLRAFGLTDAQIDGDDKELPCGALGGRTPRHAMQSLGTGWGREMIHPDLWIMAWARDAAKHAHVVCDDVRHHSEVAAIKQVGGVIINILRPGVRSRADEHSSEAEAMALPFDASISNHGTVADLAALLDGVLARVKDLA